MILKKPYAFIIKHFRAVHLFLLIPMFYLIIKTKNIVSFFAEYIANDYTFKFNNVLSSLSGNYINLFMYLAVILILVVFMFLFIILQKKEKPTRYYSVSIIYYIVIFILLTTCFSIFEQIENDTLNMTFARIIRDLAFIVHYSQYIFVIFNIIRGSGFNLKKFNFKSDLIDLEIESEDSEEFEFLVGGDPYKAKRTLRRLLRELKYYYFENKFIFSIVAVVVVVVLGTIIFRGRDITKVYGENDSIAFGFVNIKVKDSFISDLSASGSVIKNGKAYVILQIDVTNRYAEEKEFNYGNLNLVVNGKQVSPVIHLGNYFIDYGNPYTGGKIKSNTENAYVLVYEINLKDIAGSYSLVAFSGYNEKGAVNRTINIKPQNVKRTSGINYVSKGSMTDLEATNLKKTKASILGYELTNYFSFTYNYCPTVDNCFPTNDVLSITGSDIGRSTLLILDYKLELDLESTYMYSNKDYKNFFEDFMKIKYKVGHQEYYKNISIINSKYYKDKLVMKIDNEINNADEIEAIITVRNVAYSYKLK